MDEELTDDIPSNDLLLSQETYKGCEIKIFHDNECEDPRNWDPLTTMTFWPPARRTFGDVLPTFDPVEFWWDLSSTLSRDDTNEWNLLSARYDRIEDENFWRKFVLDRAFVCDVYCESGDYVTLRSRKSKLTSGHLTNGFIGYIWIAHVDASSELAEDLQMNLRLQFSDRTVLSAYSNASDHMGSPYLRGFKSIEKRSYRQIEFDLATYETYINNVAKKVQVWEGDKMIEECDSILIGDPEEIGKKIIDRRVAAKKANPVKSIVCG